MRTTWPECTGTRVKGHRPGRWVAAVTLVTRITWTSWSHWGQSSKHWPTSAWTRRRRSEMRTRLKNTSNGNTKQLIRSEPLGERQPLKSMEGECQERVVSMWDCQWVSLMIDLLFWMGDNDMAGILSLLSLLHCLYLTLRYTCYWLLVLWSGFCYALLWHQGAYVPVFTVIQHWPGSVCLCVIEIR